MSTKQWIAGINAVSAAVEHDAENVREVLIEAGAKNPRLTEIEAQARRKDIDVRRVATQALDGVVGNLRHGGPITVREVELRRPAVHLRVLADGSANWDIARPSAPPL